MRLMLVLLTLLASPSWAEADKRFRLAVPEALERTGLMDYLLPRFSLKTATRIEVVPEGAPADAAFGRDGARAFSGSERDWNLSVGPDEDAQAFGDWLASDIGRDTVESYDVDGTAPFTVAAREARETDAFEPDGDAARGETLSLTHCGRCHVVSEKNRMDAIGSTPSFAMLRTFRDWAARFQGFYALNPHPAFTQIEEVTAPFDPARPSPIAPLRMTLDELDDIVAFVDGIEPADLGAPVEAR